MAALALVGLGLMVIGGLWLLIVAFQTSILWGLGSLFVPFVSLIFVLLNWNVSKAPFITVVIGFALGMIGTSAAQA